MKKSLLFLLSLLACTALFAQEAEEVSATPDAGAFDWHFSVGVAYRKFDKPKFKVVTNVNADLEDTMLVLGGELTPITNSGMAAAAVAEGYDISRPGVGELTFANVTGGAGSATSKGSYSKSENLGGTIGGSLNLWTDGGLDLAFVANLSFFEMDSASRSLRGGSAPSADAFRQMVGWNRSGEFVRNERGPSTPAGTISSSSLSSTGKAKFDMQLWVVDAGLSLGYNFDCGLRLYVAGGPTLSLADMDTSSSGHSKDEKEFNWGLYVAGGVDFWFTEFVGIAAEVRYDDGFGTVGTRYVKQSLDTLGGSVKLLVRF
ncbi:MAG: hypothetical protein IKO65_02940 [Victivallales bacterium]|nr:hypothetical protein [Victivallales bacterium]